MFKNSTVRCTFSRVIRDHSPPPHLNSHISTACKALENEMNRGKTEWTFPVFISVFKTDVLRWNSYYHNIFSSYTRFFSF